MKFKIEKGIPIPKRSKYPFSEMEVGDSFFCDIEYSVSKHSSLAGLASQWVRNNNKEAKFTTAKEGNGVRIWRSK